MAELFDIGIFSAEDIDGSVGVGWKLTFYQTGTSTKQDTYPTEADADAGTNANTNPVLSDSAGRFPPIWLKTTGNAYKVTLSSDADVVKVTRDPAIYSLVRSLGSTASGKGASLVGFIQSGTGAVATTVQAKERQVVSTLDFIPVAHHADIIAGTSTVDVTTYIQAAIDACIAANRPYELRVIGHNRVTSTLTITNSITIVGEGVGPYDGSLGTRDGGSWFYLDHTGKGFTIDGTSLVSGVELKHFGTYRNQPTPAASWAPNAHDYDIYIDNSDVLISDLMLLNPTKGIYLTNGNAGRLEIDRLRGQAFDRMIVIYNSADVVKINNLHQWPFWQDDSDVHTYTMANLAVIQFYRNDNPMLTNIFTIFAETGILFSQNAIGKSAKGHFVNIDTDRGKYGVRVDSTVTLGIAAQFTNFTHQGEAGVTGSSAVKIDGSAVVALDITNLRSDYCGGNAIDINGSNNLVNLSGSIELYNYNQDATGAAAIDVAAGNTIRINSRPDIAGGGAGARYSTTGNIYVDEWRSYTPTITAGSGTFTTVTGSGIYKLWNDTCEYIIQVVITTNGTAASDVRATLPVTSNAGTLRAIGAGRETSGGGKMLQAQVSSAASTVIIYNYDNTYPGADGYQLYVQGNYRV